VEKPTQLLPKPEAMRLPALPGWDREDLRVLSSSMGLHADGWLETPCRLVVIQLLEKGQAARIVKLSLYLPETPVNAASAKVFRFKTESSVLAEDFCLEPGLNQIKLALKTSTNQIHKIIISGPALDTGKTVEQRRLLAVLTDLEPLTLANAERNDTNLVGDGLLQGDSS